MNDHRVDQAARDARTMWTLFEPIHAITYFGVESRAALEAAGLRGFWRGYFAGRAAPLGAVGPAPVVAAFFGFAPSMVARALPAVWEMAPPDRALAARLEGAVAGLRRLTAQGPLAGDEIEEAAELAVRAVEGLECAGRVLGAANAAVAVPTEPLGRLWWATTILREHRGDGHVAALVAAGLRACEVMAWRSSVDIPREVLQPSRGWTDEQWDAATAGLVDRGWLSSDGQPTTEGTEAFAHIELLTDRAATEPWLRLGDAGTSRLRALLTPLARVCFGEMPAQTPLGLPRPAVEVAADPTSAVA